jgi:hypothetical protein
VPAVGEANVVVVDALVGHPERLALLERHVAPIARERETRRRGTPAPRNPLAATQEAVPIGTPKVGKPPSVGEPSAVAGAEACCSSVCHGSTMPSALSSSSSARTAAYGAGAGSAVEGGWGVV